MDGLAVIGAVFFLIVVGYLGVSALLRRIPGTSLRLPTGPIPDIWDGIVEHNVPLARGLSSDERERLLRLVQVFLAEKHFEGCGGLTLTEEMKVTIAAEACLLLLHLEGPCYPTLRTVLVYPHGFVPKLAWSPGTGQIARPPARLIGESWGDGVVVISWDDTIRGARNLSTAKTSCCMSSPTNWMRKTASRTARRSCRPAQCAPGVACCRRSTSGCARTSLRIGGRHLINTGGP